MTTDITVDLDSLKKGPQLTIVDDFLTDPDQVRKMALEQDYFSSDYHKGKRTNKQFLTRDLKLAFEQLLRRPITQWAEHGMNGTFEICTSEDPIVYHSDLQTHAGTIYLTPDAPPECGLSLYKSKVTGLRRPPSDPELERKMYEGNLLDRTKWEEIDRIGNVYNRLVLWDGKQVHAASCYFGNAKENCRLFYMFFFDC